MADRADMSGGRETNSSSASPVGEGVGKETSASLGTQGEEWDRPSINLTEHVEKKKRKPMPRVQEDEQDTDANGQTEDNKTEGRKAPSKKSRPHALTKQKPIEPPKRKGRINWSVVSTDFIEGIQKDPSKEERTFPNLRELSEQHGISYQAVRARAAKENWKDRKEAHAISLIRERQKKRNKDLVGRALDFDDRALKSAELGTNLITMRLAEIAQEVKRRQRIREEALAKIDLGLPVDKTDLYSAINYRELEGLANSMSRFQEIGMKALGTDVQRHEISGPDGGDIGVTQTLNVHAEITRDDPERAAAILASLSDAGMLPMGTIEDILDAEEDEEEEQLALPEGEAE